MSTVNMLENPCRRDCPQRSQYCHGDCKDYAAYKAKLKARQNETEKGRVKHDYFWDRAGRVERIRRRKHRKK